MATTPLSSIVARANKARIQVSSLGRSAFSDLGGGGARPGTGAARAANSGGGFDFRTIGLNTKENTFYHAVGGETAPDLTDGNTSKFEIVCFPVGTPLICGGTIGNGSTFCIRKECTIISHKKPVNIVPCSRILFVRKKQDSAFIDHGMALDRLDLDFLKTWETDKVSLTDLSEWMGATK
jgi:hypothetical protein